MAEPHEQDINRNPDGTFKPGVSGNPGGRPVGSISIVSRIRQKFEEDPIYFDEWVKKLLEDPHNRKAVMEQLDGKPVQAIDHTSKGERIAGFNFIKNGDANTDNPTNA